MSEGKSDLRIIKTRKALYTAFTMLLGEKSFEDITVNELCENAMVRRATCYKHFADKYDFFIKLPVYHLQMTVTAQTAATCG